MNDDLEVLLRSRIPIIAIESRDEAQVLKSLLRACSKLTRGSGQPLFQWTVTDGLKRLDVDVGPPQRTVSEALEILKHIRATNLGGAYALLDFHPYLRDPTLIRLLKDIALSYEACPRTLVLISYQLEIPHEIEHLTAHCRLALPDRETRRQRHSAL